MRHPNLVLTAVLLAGAFGTAHAAPIHTLTIDDPRGSARGGDLKSITTSYDAGSSSFSWEYTIEDKSGSGNEHDSFWLVVSDGPNPKDHAKEYAILFGDLEADTLWAYEYDGNNGSNSWRTPGNLLAVWGEDSTGIGAPGSVEYHDDGPFEIVRDGREQTVSFSIDVAGINALGIGPEWDGIQFGEELGVWFHPGRRSTFGELSEDLGLTLYNAKAGYFDTGAPLPTMEVPEPTTLSMLGLGALAFARARRRSAHVVRG